MLADTGAALKEWQTTCLICLLDSREKLLERIICNRLRPIAKEVGGMSKQHYDFRGGWSTVNVFNAVVNVAGEAIAAIRWQLGTKKYCTFITLDVRKDRC